MGSLDVTTPTDVLRRVTAAATFGVTYVMQRPNASMTTNPAISVMTTARVQRPRRWYDGTGMYQLGNKPGGSEPIPLHATALASSATFGSAASASAVNSSSLNNPTEPSNAGLDAE